MITLVQSAKVAGSHTISFATPPVPGNLIMVACAYTDATSTSLIFPTVTDTWGSAYFSGANSEINPVQYCLVAPKTILLEEFFAVAAAVSGAWTLTATTSGHTVVMDLVIAEFHTDQGPWALSFGGTGGGLTFGGNEPLRVNAYGANYPHNSLLSACVYEMASGTPAWTFDRGFTLIDNTTGAHSLALAYRVTSDSSSGNLNVEWHAGTNGCSTNMDWRLGVTAVNWDTSIVLAASCGGPSSGMVGTPYSHTFLATGGVSPYTWSLASGILPTGLTLNPSTGVLTGTPSVADFYTFTLRITDAVGSTSNTATINIAPTLLGYDFGDSPTGQFGFEYAGNQYMFADQGAAGPAGVGDNKVHALNSLDGGLTWFELNSAGAPTTISSPGGPPTNYTICVDGSTVYVLYGTGTGLAVTNITVKLFDLASGTWGASTNYVAPLPVFIRGRWFFMQLVRRGSGDMLFYFSGPHVGGKERVYYATFNGTTFGSATLIDGQLSSFGYWPLSVGVDLAGRAHFLYQGQADSTGLGSTLWHVGMTGGGTFGTVQLVTQDDATTSSQIGQESRILSYNGNLGIVLDVYDISFHSNLTLFYAAEALNPTWHTSIITTNQSLLSFADNEYRSNASIVLTCISGTTLVCQWIVSPDGNGIGPISVYYATTDATALVWSAPALLTTSPEPILPSTSGYPNGFCTMAMQICSWSMTGGIGQAVSWSGHKDLVNIDNELLQFIGARTGASVTCSIFIDSAPDPLAISCNSPFNPVVGNAYSHTFPATGGTPSYTFAIIFGALPPGLSLNTSTGIVTGTVVSIGYYTFIIQVTDSDSNTANTGICSINVSADAGCGNALPILRGTTGTFDAQVLYPFTRYIKFVTTVNAFMNGTEQRWPNTPPLAGFNLSYSKLLSADKALWLAFFRSVKGRLSTDLSIKLGTATYCNLTLMSDDLTVVNPSALLFDQQVDLRQVNGFPWVPPTVGAAFPTFSWGAKAEQPFSQITEFLTSVNDNAYGERFPFAWYGAGLTGFPTDNLVGWKIQFRLLTDADMQILEDFFVSVKGMAETFSFTDPLSGTVYPHVRFAQDTLDILYSTKNQKSTTVSLIQVNV